MTIGLITGSVASNGLNKKLSKAVSEILHDLDEEVVFLPINKLPFYSADYDNDFPDFGKELKDGIESVEKIIIVSPEYNHSISAPLKNAIDWASRPWGSNSWAGKKVLLLTATISSNKGIFNFEATRNVLEYLEAEIVDELGLLITPNIFASNYSGVTVIKDTTINNEVRNSVKNFIA